MTIHVPNVLVYILLIVGAIILSPFFFLFINQLEEMWHDRKYNKEKDESKV